MKLYEKVKEDLGSIGAKVYCGVIFTLAGAGIVASTAIIKDYISNKNNTNPKLEQKIDENEVKKEAKLTKPYCPLNIDLKI